MLDCGLHPGFDGVASLPFLDEIDVSKIDLVLVTHFHVDHAAAVPYLLEKTTFNGRTFMTHATKAIFRWLLWDYVKVSNNFGGAEEALYNEEDMLRAYEKIEVVDYHETVEVEGIKFTGYNAGHVLGAAMFVVEIAGVKILYTGDYSREEDRHLMAAEDPKQKIDIMITESTYGVQSYEGREERENRLTGQVREVVGRGGRCLMPVFALGRTQELLLILDEYWGKHRELGRVPVYFASTLAKRCLLVYQTYIYMMNKSIQKRFQTSNPFEFRHITNLKSLAHFEDGGPCVMLASPGMLQSGLSRELFDKWVTDRKNGLVLTGYSVEGTLARTIMNEPDEVTTLQGVKVKRRMSVSYISFSAHVDYTQNSQFIALINPSNLVLVHGEQNTMARLKAALVTKHSLMSIFNPKNTEPVTLHFKGERMARVVGSLATLGPPKPGSLVDAILLHNPLLTYPYTMVTQDELPQYSNLSVVPITQNLSINFHANFSLLYFHLLSMFGDIKQLFKDHYQVYGLVELRFEAQKSRIHLKWSCSTLSDMIADSILSILYNFESSPASVKISCAESSGCGHSHSHSHSTTKPESGEMDNDTKKENENENENKSHIKAEIKSPAGNSNENETTLGNSDEPTIESQAQFRSLFVDRSDKTTSLKTFIDFLELQFSSVEKTQDNKLNIKLDNSNHATLDLSTLDITNSSSESFKRRLQSITSRFSRTLKPLI
ncbi:Cleavage and polyadenylation specificity factor subunit 3 [Zancudomyces culisetae]|uniref:Endoribonuclease YSH1 n=1 Tax=Zancudomyces culisetae TaxID=1213189 RepID=A0A1R1PDC3_ZANCU|nr:Cleavage and polyadenylation specificity factor subunit 3 [Zancudomyces culisetae]|eukprot:OMH78941.1 Cleavage and polyadenylation specificity factor subunit 3 [Zancudomyces culisetae]